MDIILVRHGQSEANAGLTDHLDSGLTSLGRRQAELTGERLKSGSITQAFVSPLRRTLETMQVICEKANLRATAFPAIHEYFSPRHVEYLKFEGLPETEIRAQFPLIDISDEIPCGPQWWPRDLEDIEKAYARTERVCDFLCTRYSEPVESILIVTHADPIGWMIETFTGTRTASESPPWVDNCSITRIRTVGNDVPAMLLSLNDTSHLQGA
jgi:broad specificity phosphatase PhoE